MFKAEKKRQVQSVSWYNFRAFQSAKTLQPSQCLYQYFENSLIC